MTRPTDPAATVDSKDATTPSKPSVQELDAEILRDLDADEVAGDVRGGPCTHSNTIGVAGQ